MKTSDIKGLVDELAGHWTAPTLDALKAAGIREVSVEMEIETWRVLKGVLHGELRAWPRVAIQISLTGLRERVVQRAALVVAQRFDPRAVNFWFRTRLNLAVRGQRATVAERSWYEELVSRSQLQAAFKTPGWTDLVPRLRVSALAAHL